jgi:hypothetical protein
MTVIHRLKCLLTEKPSRNLQISQSDGLWAPVWSVT